MNFNFSDEDEVFRAEVHEFLSSALPDWWFNQQAQSDALWAFGRDFAKELARKHWLVMAWPPEWGGSNAPAWKQLVLAEELAAHQAPPDGMGIGVSLIGPLIMQIGTTAQQQHHLPGIATGEIVWAECFSEPNVGSDLASLESRAVRSGDGWVLSGEKVWISHGARSDWALVLARTDSSARKHQGITAFLVDLRSAGVSARELDFIVGSEYVSEVRFDSVQVPASAVLGELGRGFYYAMSSVGVERAIATKYASMKLLLHRLIRYAGRTAGPDGPLLRDMGLRERIAAIMAEIEASKLMSYYATDLASRGTLGAEASLIFAWDTEVQQRLQNLAMDIVGEEGRLNPECEHAPLRGLLAARDGRAIHSTIAPGTLEIQKMVAATRLLGLPRG